MRPMVQACRGKARQTHPGKDSAVILLQVRVLSRVEKRRTRRDSFGDLTKIEWLRAG